MSFIRPQFASPIPVGWQPTVGEWVAEEKFDGHRLIVEVGGPGQQSIIDGQTVNAWSRYGATRALPPHVSVALAQLPAGIYDGELCVPGGRSYGVTELVQQDRLAYVVFDLLELVLNGQHTNMHGLNYDQRRTLLEEIFEREMFLALRPHVSLAVNIAIDSWDDIIQERDRIWARDGEGLILKRRTSWYHPGKRPKDWLKVKKLQSAVLTVTGFAPSRGELNDRGPFAVVLLKDDEGHDCSVKTRNDEELARLTREGHQAAGVDAPPAHRRHPAIGRRLRIEFQERTPDGSYRHPRWDRWEDE